jgi:aspartyl aminopeptidase
MRYVRIRIPVRNVLTKNLQVNPLYEGKYQDQHKPQLNGGVVIKMNANQRYTSNPATTFALRRLAEMSGIPIQEFEVRNDSSCGSTVSIFQTDTSNVPNVLYPS